MSEENIIFYYPVTKGSRKLYKHCFKSWIIDDIIFKINSLALFLEVMKFKE